MDMTPELKAALEKQMTAYLEEYFNANASDALREKVKAEKKTVAGAYKFIESVAKAFAKAGCCAMPDALAYGLLMHYMEDEKEGAIYKTPEQVQAEIDKAKRAEAEKAKAKAPAESPAKVKAEALRQKVAEENANALIKTSAKALREGEKAVEADAAERAALVSKMKEAERLEAEKRKAEAVERIVLEQATFAF